MTERGAGGIYGEGEPFIENTYNGECALSQVIQYGYYQIDDTEYVCLSIHGGCDVRGGYTRPRIFEVTQEIAIVDNAKVGRYCDDCDSGWYSDDGGCHWYANNYECEMPKEVVVFEHDEYSETELAAGVAEYFESQCYQPDQIAVLKKDGYKARVFCPECGGELKASGF